MDIVEQRNKRKKLMEGLPKGTDERVLRNIRPPKVTPSAKSNDKTPRKPANNDPTKTARGKAAVKKRGEENKKHPEKFLEHASEFLKRVVELDWEDVAPAVADLRDPIEELNHISGLIDEFGHNDTLLRIKDTIRNVWEDRAVERYVGVAKAKDHAELRKFDQAREVIGEFKEWGAKLCWIERICKGNFVIYKACGDPKVPSGLYTERKALLGNNVILPDDRSNISQIIYGDQ